MTSDHRTRRDGAWRIGALHELHTQPLYHSIKSSPENAGELFFDTPAKHIDKLLSRECEAAFVFPIDYALNSSDLVIFPGIGVTSQGIDNTLRLYLRGELHSISSMAIGEISSTDVVLARIVLAEKYDSAPAIVPVAGSLDDMLKKADCALVAGDMIHTLNSQRPYIDIIDEWTDITELSFVHTVCVTREEYYSDQLREFLSASQQAGRIELEGISRMLAKEKNLDFETLYQFLQRFSYGLDETSVQSLETFFKMAFYHGMLADVPEINIAG